MTNTNINQVKNKTNRAKMFNKLSRRQKLAKLIESQRKDEKYGHKYYHGAF